LVPRTIINTADADRLFTDKNGNTVVVVGPVFFEHVYNPGAEKRAASSMLHALLNIARVDEDRGSYVPIHGNKTTKRVLRLCGLNSAESTDVWDYEVHLSLTTILDFYPRHIQTAVTTPASQVQLDGAAALMAHSKLEGKVLPDWVEIKVQETNRALGLREMVGGRRATASSVVGRVMGAKKRGTAPLTPDPVRRPSLRVQKKCPARHRTLAPKNNGQMWYVVKGASARKQHVRIKNRDGIHYRNPIITKLYNH